MEESYLNPYYFQVAFEREPLYTSKDMESPEPFSQTLNGLIYLSSYDEDGEPTNEEDEIIGAFRLQFINGSLAEEYPVNLFEIFDLEQETLDYYEDVIDVCKNEYSPVSSHNRWRLNPNNHRGHNAFRNANYQPR